MKINNVNKIMKENNDNTLYFSINKKETPYLQYKQQLYVDRKKRKNSTWFELIMGLSTMGFFPVI